MPIDKTEEPTLEEKYGPVALRYLGDKEGIETVGGVAGLDVAIERLCNELSENDGPLEQLRLLQEAEDEWAALRGLLPEKEPTAPASEDKPLIARMEGIRMHIATLSSRHQRPARRRVNCWGEASYLGPAAGGEGKAWREAR
jgi:hypothetical protein